MNILFVTGSGSAFFNSLLVCLQSFAERMPGRRLFVCDFGFTHAQAAFLRCIGLLLERPPELASGGVFHCKAGLLSYLRHGGHDVGDDDVMVWLDADLTFMEIGVGDFETVIAAMSSARAGIAGPEPLGRTIGQMLSTMPEGMAPSARVVAEAAVDPSLPYVSSGLFFCRSAAALRHWQELAHAVADSPLFEQNMFNVVLHRDRIAFLALDCEEWQAQGPLLDRIRLVPSAHGGRPVARIGNKNIKTLHATSGLQGHLLIGLCRMTVPNLDLAGPFKLFLAEPLRMHQLQLLASFVAEHGETLLRFGICTPAARPAAGF
jgi:hypothetical protein